MRLEIFGAEKLWGMSQPKTSSELDDDDPSLLLTSQKADAMTQNHYTTVATWKFERWRMSAVRLVGVHYEMFEF